MSTDIKSMANIPVKTGCNRIVSGEYDAFASDVPERPPAVSGDFGPGCLSQ